MSIIIKNIKTTKEYYEAFMEIHKKINDFPNKLMEQLETETSITGFGRGMRIVKFSDLIGGTWSPRSRVSNYINLRKDVIENFCEMLKSYSHKGLPVISSLHLLLLFHKSPESPPYDD